MRHVRVPEELLDALIGYAASSQANELAHICRKLVPEENCSIQFSDEAKLLLAAIHLEMKTMSLNIDALTASVNTLLTEVQTAVTQIAELNKDEALQPDIDALAAKVAAASASLVPPTA